MAGDLQVSFILRAIDRATGPLKKVTKNFEAMGRASRRASKAFKISANLKQSGQAALTVGRTITKALAGPIQAWEEYEAALARVQGKGKFTAEEMKRLDDEAIRLGKTVGEFDPTGVADGMLEMATAGFLFTDIISAMPTFLDASTSSQMNLSDSIKGITGVLGGYGLGVDKVGFATDIMTAAVNASKATQDGFNETLSFVGPILAKAGVGFDRAAVAVGVLANASIVGSRAGTALNQVMRVLSGAARGIGGEAIEKAGIKVSEFRDGIVQMRDPIKILAELNEKFKDLSGQEKLKEFTKIFRDGAAGAIILGESLGTIKLAKLNKQVAIATSSTKKMADTFRDTSENKTKQLTSAITTASIAMGRNLAETTNAAKKALQGLVESVLSFTEANPALTKWLLILTGVIGGLAFFLGGLLITFSALASTWGVLVTGAGVAATVIAFLTPIFTSVAAAVVIFSTGVGILASSLWAAVSPALILAAPFILWGVAIAAVITLIVQLIRKWDDIKKINFLGGGFGGFLSAVGDLGSTLNPFSSNTSKGGFNMEEDAREGPFRLASPLSSINGAAGASGEVSVNVNLGPGLQSGGVESSGAISSVETIDSGELAFGFP